MKDAKAVKETMKRKIKKIKKKNIKRTLFMMGLTAVLSMGAMAVLLYNRMFFQGEVKDKYQLDSETIPGVLQNYILVKTWFGEKDFCVDDEVYENVQIGASYTFQKESVVDRVRLKENKKTI